MYCLFELLAVACAAVVLVNEGVRKVLRLSAACLPRIASFLSTARKGWKITVPDQLGSLITEEGKL